MTGVIIPNKKGGRDEAFSGPVNSDTSSRRKRSCGCEGFEKDRTRTYEDKELKIKCLGEDEETEEDRGELTAGLHPRGKGSGPTTLKRTEAEGAAGWHQAELLNKK